VLMVSSSLLRSEDLIVELTRVPNDAIGLAAKMLIDITHKGRAEAVTNKDIGKLTIADQSGGTALLLVVGEATLRLAGGKGTLVLEVSLMEDDEVTAILAVLGDIAHEGRAESIADIDIDGVAVSDRRRGKTLTLKLSMTIPRLLIGEGTLVVEVALVVDDVVRALLEVGLETSLKLPAEAIADVNRNDTTLTNKSASTAALDAGLEATLGLLLSEGAFVVEGVVPVVDQDVGNGHD